MNPAAELFMRSVRASFPFFDKEEKRFYNDLYDNVRCYSNFHRNCTTDDLIEYYGEPKDIVMEYYSNVSTPNVYFELVKKARRVAVAMVIAIIMATLLFSMVIITEKLKFDSADNIIHHEETVTAEYERGK